MNASSPDSLIEYVLLSYNPPGGERRNIGVMVWDEAGAGLFFRLLSDYSFADEFDQQILELLPQDLEVKIKELGPRGLLSYFEATLSGVFQISERTRIRAADPLRVLDDVYRVHVAVI